MRIVTLLNISKKGFWWKLFSIEMLYLCVVFVTKSEIVNNLNKYSYETDN